MERPLLIALLLLFLVLIPAAGVRAEQFSGKDGVIYQFTPPVGYVESRTNPGLDINFVKGTNASTISVLHEQLLPVQGNQSLALQQYANQKSFGAYKVNCGTLNGNPTCTLSVPPANSLTPVPPVGYFIQNKHTVFALSFGGRLNDTASTSAFKAYAHSFKIIKTPQVYEIQ